MLFLLVILGCNGSDIRWLYWSCLMYMSSSCVVYYTDVVLFVILGCNGSDIRWLYWSCLMYMSSSCVVY